MRTYLDFCITDHETAAIEAWQDVGSVRGAARKLGKDRNTVKKQINRVKERAALAGFIPEQSIDHQTHSGHVYSGYSMLERTEDGLIWHKVNRNQMQQRQAIEAAAQAFYEDVPVVSVPDGPLHCNSTIIPWIQIGDAHLGMLAHEWETGQNFDMDIAERELRAGVSMLIDSLGEHERCVINDLGDFTHYENFAGVTEASGHSLDVDGRFPKMIAVYSRLMRCIVDYSLTKFQYVDVIINQGNHSRTNDIWMVELLKVAYRETDRVNVLDNSSVFIPYRMGNTFVMTHHSDKCKPNKLAQVMATDFRHDWGETEYHYIDIGHIHHNMVSKEHPGVTIESFNQLAAPDKYAHDGGWRSRQSITAILRCKKYGEVGRRTLPIEQIRDMIYDACGGESRTRRNVYSV